MDALLLIVCGGLTVAGLAIVVTAFKVVPRESSRLPPSQLVIDGKHDFGDRRSPRIRVRKSRLVRGILILAVAAITSLAMVSYILDHMKLGFSGHWFPGN